MVFYNNPHAAQAMLQNRQEQLSDRLATKRPAQAVGRPAAPSSTPLPRTKPAIQAAA